ncbi:MAG: methionyl-tRNA formyltransferase [Clostridia bacterium]|nr:methionyl-tRNA formyltransferase [Clostridia bacterium]
MKIVYAGTPRFAVAPLKKIIGEGYGVAGVVVQPDKPQGRKGILAPPPVKAFALERGLTVFQPQKIRAETDALKALGGDILITCAYGQILTQEVLDLFPLGVWNIHASLLPKYRGASPIQSAVLNGERETGVTVMKTALGLDTGDILLSLKTEIGEKETFGELSDRLSLLGAEALLKALQSIEKGNFALVKQRDEDAVLTRKIAKESAKIDFSLPAEKIVNLVRGMNPEPTAFAEIEGARLNVFCAERAVCPEGSEGAAAGEILSDTPKQGFLVKCGDGAVKLAEVQAAGGRRMKGSDFLNGRKVKKGQVFSC